jgi:hypothetical protein
VSASTLSATRFTDWSSGADVGAAVFDLSDDALLESISLHPDVLRTNARAKIALPQASRLEVLQHGEGEILRARTTLTVQWLLQFRLATA